MVKTKMFLMMLGVIVAVGLTGCANSQKAGVYQTSQAQTSMRVMYATALEVRDVEIEHRNSGVGASAGAVAGGIGGSHMGKGTGNIVGGIAGAVVGGLMGSALEKGVMGKQGVEIVYRQDGSNENRVLVQEKDESNLIAPGDRIRLVEDYSTLRAVRVGSLAPQAQ